MPPFPYKKYNFRRDILLMNNIMISITVMGKMAGDSVAVMINNLGGTSILELNIVAKEVIAYLGNCKSHSV